MCEGYLMQMCRHCIPCNDWQVAYLLTPSLGIIGMAVLQVCLQPLQPQGPPALQFELADHSAAKVTHLASCGTLPGALL